LIETSREVNEYMPDHVAEKTLRGLNECGKVLQESTVLVLGLAYKPGVGDIRTSVVGDVIGKLKEYGVKVIGVDPHADPEAATSAFDVPIQDQPDFTGVDGILLATPHDSLRKIDFADVADRMADDPVLVDVDGVLDRERLTDAPLLYDRL